MLLSLADLLWSALIVAPLVVLFWRGTWDILDVVVSILKNLIGLNRTGAVLRLFRAIPTTGLERADIQLAVHFLLCLIPPSPDEI